MSYLRPTSASISSSWQGHKNRRPPSQEPGTDYACAYGTTLVAPASGRIVGVQTSTAGATGRFLTIDLDDGRRIRWLHLSAILVGNGARVSRGQGIARSGASAWGREWGVGAHVHVSLFPSHSYGGFGPNSTLDFERYIGNSGVDGSGKLVEDGELGPATIKAMQKVLGVTQDGEWGYNTTLALQKKLIAAGHKIAADGDLGPATIRAMQTFLLGAKHADGEIGPQTIRGLQHYLNTGGKFVVVRPPAPATPDKLVVDGEWGPATTKALQRSLGVTVDGELGPETYRAWQKALGVPVDGEMGPQTRKAYQTAIGATPDGEVGPETVRKLQEFLNAGKKFTKVTLPVEPVKPPAAAATPRTPVYPAALRGWNVPLSSDRPVGQAVDRLIIHHQGSTNDDEEYFKTKNSRGSCPTWQVKKDGTVVELISPDKKPSSTGEWNSRSYAVETQNSSMAPDWGISDAAHEAIARIAVWVSQRPGSKITLDREHIIGHNETGAATACPGPSMDLDRIVTRAIELAKATESAPEGTVPVERSWLQSLFDKLKSVLK